VDTWTTSLCLSHPETTGGIHICCYMQWWDIGRSILLFTHSALALLGFYIRSVIRYHSLQALGFFGLENGSMARLYT